VRRLSDPHQETVNGNYAQNSKQGCVVQREDLLEESAGISGEILPAGTE
jgi:hypothetical protein